MKVDTSANDGGAADVLGFSGGNGVVQCGQEQGRLPGSPIA
jgi:hypothetical protein